MKKIAIALCVLAAPAGAQTMPSESDFVPAERLLEEIAETPYECTGYDASSDSCEVLSFYQREGETILNGGQFVVSMDPRITGSAYVPLQIRDGKFCGDLDDMDLRLEGGEPGMEDMVIAIMRQAMEPYGEICSSYYRTGTEGEYTSVVRGESGEVVPEGVDVMQFFAEPKAIRAEDAAL